MIGNRLSQLSNSTMQLTMQHLFIQDGFIRCRMIRAANAAACIAFLNLESLASIFLLV